MGDFYLKNKNLGKWNAPKLRPIEDFWGILKQKVLRAQNLLIN